MAEIAEIIIPCTEPQSCAQSKSLRNLFLLFLPFLRDNKIIIICEHYEKAI